MCSMELDVFGTKLSVAGFSRHQYLGKGDGCIRVDAGSGLFDSLKIAFPDRNWLVHHYTQCTSCPGSDVESVQLPIDIIRHALHLVGTKVISSLQHMGGPKGYHIILQTEPWVSIQIPKKHDRNVSSVGKYICCIHHPSVC